MKSRLWIFSTAVLLPMAVISSPSTQSHMLAHAPFTVPIAQATTLGCRVPYQELDAEQEPTGDVKDSQKAEEFPCDYAWKLFVSLNHQAYAPGKAEPGRKWTSFDSDKDVVWESWALGSGTEVFPVSGPPARWGKWHDRDKKQHGKKKLTKSFTGGTDSPIAHGGFTILNPPSPTILDNKEVRMNKETYDVIRSGGLNGKGLYTQQLIQNEVRKALKPKPKSLDPTFATFPPKAKAVKAAWVILCATENQLDCAGRKARYHWRIINGKIWGLAALHIMAKGTTPIENWFWTDFIHSDCATLPEPAQPCTFGQQADMPRSAPYPGTAGTKWAYYRLRGIQKDFHDANGNPTVLSNPLIEKDPHSSCITCHMYAAAAEKSTRAEQVARQARPAGEVQECNFHGPPPFCTVRPNQQPLDPRARTYARSGFDWSIITRAQPGLK